MDKINTLLGLVQYMQGITITSPNYSLAMDMIDRSGAVDGLNLNLRGYPKINFDVVLQNMDLEKERLNRIFLENLDRQSKLSEIFPPVEGSPLYRLSDVTDLSRLKDESEMPRELVKGINAILHEKIGYPEYGPGFYRTYHIKKLNEWESTSQFLDYYYSIKSDCTMNGHYSNYLMEDNFTTLNGMLETIEYLADQGSTSPEEFYLKLRFRNNVILSEDNFDSFVDLTKENFLYKMQLLRQNLYKGGQSPYKVYTAREFAVLLVNAALNSSISAVCDVRPILATFRGLADNTHPVVEDLITNSKYFLGDCVEAEKTQLLIDSLIDCQETTVIRNKFDVSKYEIGAHYMVKVYHETDMAFMGDNYRLTDPRFRR